jgi:predicted nucleic acid-binding protein
VIDAFVDTNVFVYVVDTDEPEKRATAIALLDELKGRIGVSAQVLNEYYVTVTRKLPVPNRAGRAVRAVAGDCPSSTSTGSSSWPLSR